MSSQSEHIVKVKWRSPDAATDDGKDFSFLNLDNRIIAGLFSSGYTIPRSFQLKAIPLCRTGTDVFLQGEAGAGKTLILSILALNAVLEAEDQKVLIITPTREGAFQICNTVCAIGSKVEHLRCDCFIGGIGYDEDIPRTRGCNIAVGTPGRLEHLIRDQKLKIDNTRLFMIDDFDELLDMSTRSEINKIFEFLPENKQMVVASPFCSEDVLKLASRYLKSEFQTLCSDNDPSLSGMTHYYCIVPVDSVTHWLSYRFKIEILKTILLKVKFSQCIVFCNNIDRVEVLCTDIKSWEFNAISTSKEKDQVHRLQVVEAMKKNKYKILVSTDVSSQGLDAPNIDLVINFEVPYSSRVYLRRCGRAGRFGAKCSSITFVSKDQIDRFAEMQDEGQFNSYALPDPIPEDLSCDIETSIQCFSKTACDSIKKLASSTNWNNYSTINLEKNKVTQNKKISHKNLKKEHKKFVKSSELSKSQIISKCNANQSSTKFYSGNPANNHIDQVTKNCKIRSSPERHLDRCVCLSKAGNFNVQGNVKPCHASSQHSCHCPNIYHQSPFMTQRDIFYNQFMFIHNFSHFWSHFK